MSDVEVAVLAGASLAALHAVVTSGQGEAPPFLGVLRALQALAAAARCAPAARLREDDAALRDALLLAAPQAALSPAGRLHALFRLFGAPRFKGDDIDIDRPGSCSASPATGPAMPRSCAPMSPAPASRSGD